MQRSTCMNATLKVTITCIKYMCLQQLKLQYEVIDFIERK